MTWCIIDAQQYDYHQRYQDGQIAWQFHYVGRVLYRLHVVVDASL